MPLVVSLRSPRILSLFACDKLLRSRFSAEKVMAAQSITLQSIFLTKACRKLLAKIVQAEYKEEDAHPFFPNRPTSFGIEAVDIFVFWLRPIVRCQIGVVIYRPPGCNRIQRRGLIQMTAEQVIVEFEGWRFGVDQFIAVN